MMSQKGQDNTGKIPEKGLHPGMVSYGIGKPDPLFNLRRHKNWGSSSTGSHRRPETTIVLP